LTSVDRLGTADDETYTYDANGNRIGGVRQVAHIVFG